MQEVFERLIDQFKAESVIVDDDAGNRAVEIIEQAAAEYNNGWIPVEERLPENAKNKGAFCPKYQVMTKYGVTEGWYNPNFESWFILVWFMNGRYLESEIDFERGTKPKVVRCDNRVNDKYGIVMAWRCLPEPYQTKGE